MTSRRIQTLRKSLAEKQQSALKTRQNTDIIELENNYTKEYNDLSQAWEIKFEEFKEVCKETEKILIERQLNEMETEKKNIEENVTMVPKHSSEYLNLSKILQNHIKNKNYQEAHRIQQQLESLKIDKTDFWQENRQKKIEKRVSLIKKRHEKELENSRKRAKAGFEELKKKQTGEIEE